MKKPRSSPTSSRMRKTRRELRFSRKRPSGSTAWIASRSCAGSTFTSRDLSGTPYFLGRHRGRRPATSLPWVVSDFGLIDAIESGTGQDPPARRSRTRPVRSPGPISTSGLDLPKLTARRARRKRGNPKPEAILKWAHTPIGMLGGMGDEMPARMGQGRWAWAARLHPGLQRTWGSLRPFTNGSRKTGPGRRPHRRLSRRSQPGRGSNNPGGYQHRPRDRQGEAKGDEYSVDAPDSGYRRPPTSPADPQGRQIYPEGFRGTREEAGPPLHPPGRDVHCIVSVGMLTEGWDCNTVTHVIGLRPFHSQLLCEQVVGRGPGAHL